MKPSPQKPITLYLCDQDADALDQLAIKKGLTKTAMMRQALRLYQLVDAKLDSGEKFFFEDEGKQKSQLVML